MNILHTISGMSINAGGPTTCLYNLVKGVTVSGIKTQILTFSPSKNDKLITKDVLIQTVHSPKEKRYGYSIAFKEALSRYENIDIFHTNGLWQFTTHIGAVYARKRKTPYIVSPHGMLYPEALKKSLLFKKTAMTLYQRKDLSHATVIHATCQQEMKHIRQLGFRNSIAVIPNAVEIPAVSFNNNKKKKKQVGFIGRFAPIKNIEMLLRAWSLSGKSNPEWELVFIGDGEPSYCKNLHKLVHNLNIKNIMFTGFLSGDDKESALLNLDYLVLPSKSENFGMVVAEALIRKIPVIASNGTPWEELNIYNAGWWIDIGVLPLANTLNKALSLSESDRTKMGLNGRKLIEEKYSIQSVARQMILLYQWILGKISRPDFVMID